MKYYTWKSPDMENPENKVQISKKEANVKFGKDFVDEVTKNFKSVWKTKSVISVTYNLIGSEWEEDFMYNLTIEK